MLYANQMQIIYVFFLCWAGDAGSLFTGVNYNLYQAPGGFCFDILCDDDPIIDNVESREYNVEKKVIQYCH